MKSQPARTKEQSFLIFNHIDTEHDHNFHEILILLFARIFDLNESNEKIFKIKIYITHLAVPVLCALTEALGYKFHGKVNCEDGYMRFALM